MAPSAQSIISFTGVASCFVARLRTDGLVVTYWGPRLDEIEPEVIDSLGRRTPAIGTPSVEVPTAMCPTIASGFIGSPGIELHKDGGAWDFHPDESECLEVNEAEATFRFTDTRHGLVLMAELLWCAETDVLKVRHSVENGADGIVTLNACASATLPVPASANMISRFGGRWALEFQQSTFALEAGAFVQENRRGRTSHASFPALLLHSATTTESQGVVYGFHLGWSGNHIMRVERLNDGRAYAQLGDRLLPGEIRLAKGERYQTPWLYAAFSGSGFSSLSQSFHRFAWEHVLRPSTRQKPRPVHYNTWEAIYFDHDQGKLIELASRAAALGVERFVLDDGWFLGRRHDAAGLGDWYVDPQVYPQGLTPLIDHVLALGMDFGLWVEPEMVNPDSDLYRAHPDWVLSAEGIEQIPSRNQLVLDLTRDEVWAYVFERLDDLLAHHAISYLKWDMNRDIHHTGSGGAACAHAQTRAVYSLMDAVRAKHPHVEIESCSSGGARADFGALSHTDRVWTSDSNDALDRQAIQRGASFFLPSDVMGAHVGPRVCHITERELPMSLRAATALFGHMGLEMDLTELTEEEAETLKVAIALHKRHRALIHGGNLVRLDGPAYSNSLGIVSEDGSAALFSYAQTGTRQDTTPTVLTVKGLDPGAKYFLDIVWPTSDELVDLSALGQLKGQAISGQALMQLGLQLPPMMPHAAVILHLQA